MFQLSKDKQLIGEKTFDDTSSWEAEQDYQSFYHWGHSVPISCSFEDPTHFPSQPLKELLYMCVQISENQFARWARAHFWLLLTDLFHYAEKKNRNLISQTQN